MPRMILELIPEPVALPDRRLLSGQSLGLIPMPVGKRCPPRRSRRRRRGAGPAAHRISQHVRRWRGHAVQPPLARARRASAAARGVGEERAEGTALTCRCPANQPEVVPRHRVVRPDRRFAPLPSLSPAPSPSPALSSARMSGASGPRPCPRPRLTATEASGSPAPFSGLPRVPALDLAERPAATLPAGGAQRRPPDLRVVAPDDPPAGPGDEAVRSTGGRSGSTAPSARRHRMRSQRHCIWLCSAGR
jgi:hypothetical protein